MSPGARIKSTHPVLMALLGIPKSEQNLILRESDSTCLFDRLNTFCSVGPAPREDNANDIRPSPLSKRMEEHINGTVGSFSRIANP